MHLFWSIKMTQSEPRSFAWTTWRTRSLLPSLAPCAHLPPPGVQMNLCVSLSSLISHIGWDSEFIWQWSRSPDSSQLERDWGLGVQVKYWRNTHLGSRHWEGLCWKILRNSYPLNSWAETIWPANPEVFIIWTFTGKSLLMAIVGSYPVISLFLVILFLEKLFPFYWSMCMHERSVASVVSESLWLYGL